MGWRMGWRMGGWGGRWEDGVEDGRMMKEKIRGKERRCGSIGMAE